MQHADSIHQSRADVPRSIEVTTTLPDGKRKLDLFFQKREGSKITYQRQELSLGLEPPTTLWLEPPTTL